MSRLAIFLLLLAATCKLYSQREITTVGIQFKPIVNSDLLNTGEQTITEGDISFNLKPNQGYGFGMIIRQGFNEQFSLETGINYTRRNFELTISEDSTGFSGTSDFGYVIYEIPVLGLIYVQLGQESYLNAAFGINFNFLPTNWESFDTYFSHFSQRTSWIIPALQANLGYEYRTKKSGFFYLGFSYHQPFQDLTTAGVQYGENIQAPKERAFFEVAGNYLTLDFRYFFHEEPKWKQQRNR